MPSPGDEVLCLRCATPLAKPAEEQAIDQALGLGPSGDPDIDPVKQGISGDYVDDTFCYDDEPEIAVDDLDELPADTDDWELELTSAETRRLLGQSLADDAVVASASTNESFASLLQMAVSAPTISNSSPPVVPRQSGKPRGGGSGLKSFAAWAAICLGLMAFACGGVLLGWSVLGDREELWSLGVPIALVGQVALLVGLCLQLDRLWGENRNTAERIVQMDEQLDELRQSTRLLGTPYHSASQNFYTHLSDGASPKMLLSDLKGQMDLLALRMSQEENRR